MVKVPLDNQNNITVYSNYDSSKHLGFCCQQEDINYCNTKSLNELLTKEQIKSVEALIAVTVKSYIKYK